MHRLFLYKSSVQTICKNHLFISRTSQRSCRAAHGAKHLPFCAAAIRRAYACVTMLLWSIAELSVYLSGGLKPATETSRILTYGAVALSRKSA